MLDAHRVFIAVGCTTVDDLFMRTVLDDTNVCYVGCSALIATFMITQILFKTKPLTHSYVYEL